MFKDGKPLKSAKRKDHKSHSLWLLSAKVAFSTGLQGTIFSSPDIANETQEVVEPLSVAP